MCMWLFVNCKYFILFYYYILFLVELADQYSIAYVKRLYYCPSEKANHKGSEKTELPRFQIDASRSTDSKPMLGYFAVPFLPLPLTHVLVAEDHIQNLVPRGGRARFSISCTHSRACTVVFNNNSVHLSIAQQRPERPHDTH